MNLWNIKAGAWNEKLLSLAGGAEDTTALKKKLGQVPEDGGINLGNISTYFVHRYSFNPSCTVVPSTGDNPSTILALPLVRGFFNPVLPNFIDEISLQTIFMSSNLSLRSDYFLEEEWLITTTSTAPS